MQDVCGYHTGNMKLILCNLIPNLSATSLACSGVIAISPLGTLTPYLLNMPILRCSCRDRCLLHNIAGPLVSCTVDRKYINSLYTTYITVLIIWLVFKTVWRKKIISTSDGHAAATHNFNRKPAFKWCFLTSLWESWMHTFMPSWLQQRNLDPSRHAILRCTKLGDPSCVYDNIICPGRGVVCITCLSHV